MGTCNSRNVMTVKSGTVKNSNVLFSASCSMWIKEKNDWQLCEVGLYIANYLYIDDLYLIDFNNSDIHDILVEGVSFRNHSAIHPLTQTSFNLKRVVSIVVEENGEHPEQLHFRFFDDETFRKFAFALCDSLKDNKLNGVQAVQPGVPIDRDNERAENFALPPSGRENAPNEESHEQ